jgi:hypothetical protein
MTQHPYPPRCNCRHAPNTNSYREIKSGRGGVAIRLFKVLSMSLLSDFDARMIPTGKDKEPDPAEKA